jgi:Carboxypeptidase regulatory-like domain/TonB dependent receptor
MLAIRRASLMVVAAFVLAAATPSFAQLTRGSIGGTVRDNTGGAIPGATVTITNNATGLVRSTTTDAEGVYRAPALEPGEYTVKVELQGFKAVENKAVPVTPTSHATLDVALELGSFAEAIDVTATSEAITLNKTNGTIGMTATSRQAVELPLGGARTINNLALLAPNVTSSVGQSNISANGQNSRNNNYMIDGTDNNDVSVTLATVPVVPESVAEFNVQTNPYNVEFGRNSGAQLNIITKSGTNSLHGDVFEYYRDSDLNARTNVEKRNNLSEPTPFERHQVGAGAGGPIVKNRAFFYGLFQYDRQRADTLGAITRMPTPAGFQTLQNVPLRSGQSAASRQAVLQRLGFLQDVYGANPTFSNITNQLVNGVPVETGQTAVTRDTPVDTWYYIARSDVSLASSDNLTLRFIRNKPESTNNTSNTAFGALFAASSVTIDQNFTSSYTKVLGPTTLNEARFAWVKRDLSFPENDPDSPTAGITGLFTIGGLSNFPQGRVQDTWQFMDVLTFQRGRHSLKAGADIRYVTLDNLAAFDSKGTFTFNSLQDYMNNNAVSFAQALQTSSYDATQWFQAYFLQDDWRPTPNLTINLGLRYENSTVPLGLFGATQPEVLAALVPGPTKKDNNNWAPRVGFAYSPSASGGFAGWLFGDTTSSIRGGYGISYDVIFYNILTVNGSNYPRVVVGRIDNALDLYPNVAPTTGAAVFSPTATFVNSPEDMQSPEAHVWSLSWQRELSRQYVFEVGYTGSLGRHGISQGQANYAVLTPEQAATVRTTLSTTSIPTVQNRRLFPQFGSRVIIGDDSSSEYHALFGSFNKRFSSGLQFGVSYTFSRLYSDGDESLALGFTGGSPQIPQDFANLDVEWSRSVFDRPHRLAVNWIYEVPWFESGFMGNVVMRQVFGGWQVSGIMQAQSGQPFGIVTGVDSNGNGSGGDRPNVGSGRLVADPVTGNFRTFTNEGAYVAPLGTNNLPIAFSLGNGNALRNDLRGPGFTNWDISLSKKFRFFTTQALTVRADFLNAFNQDSYQNPVSNMTSTDFGKNIQNWGNRSITLGVKYSF